eukprot:GHVR01142244.1.p1 GENE.GHVR01142244.1~~GHVR01142244.1.p1  ORF type:complete len:518 (+),score=120.84 GHVR01142244.1:29-1582(+)
MNIQNSITRRKEDYKKGFDNVEARRQREDTMIQIRKNKREENLQRRRRLEETPALSSQGQIPATSSCGKKYIKEQLPQMVQGIMAADHQQQFISTQQFRKLLSIEQNPPIQEVTECGVVPRFVEFLSEFNRPEIQFEAAWALTNVASGSPEQTKVVIECGAVPIFVKLLQSPNSDVREQAVWALGNIAGDSTNCRDLVLQSGALAPLLQQLRESEKFSMLRNATWTLSNLCRGKPPPNFEWVSPALPALANLVFCGDVEVLADACWALSYLSDGQNEKIEAVIQSGVCKRLVDLLMHTSPLVQTPALRTVGNIVTGNDLQTQVIIQCGAIPNLLSLLSSQKKSIRKEACWTISNITAGSREQIQEVLNGGIIPQLVTLLSTADFDIQKEAAWGISNATSGGNLQQVEYMVMCGCVAPLCGLLRVKDTKIVSVALEALENILRMGASKQKDSNLPDNPWIATIEQCDGVEQIEKLQEDANEEIYNKAVALLERYFPVEEDEEDVSGLPYTAPTQGYQF